MGSRPWEDLVKEFAGERRSLSGSWGGGRDLLEEGCGESCRTPGKAPTLSLNYLKGEGKSNGFCSATKTTEEKNRHSHHSLRGRGREKKNTNWNLSCEKGDLARGGLFQEEEKFSLDPPRSPAGVKKRSRRACSGRFRPDFSEKRTSVPTLVFWDLKEGCESKESPAAEEFSPRVFMKKEERRNSS